MRKAYLAIICLFTGFNAFAQHTDIQPVPQQISESGQLITLPGSYQFTGDTEANPYAVQQLKQLLVPLLACVKRLWKSNIDMALSFAPNTSL